MGQPARTGTLPVAYPVAGRREEGDAKELHEVNLRWRPEGEEMLWHLASGNTRLR